MAPDKIYLQENTTTDCYEELWPEWFEGQARESDICYIRKDALLEWAKAEHNAARIDAENYGERYDYGKADAFNELIDELNSL